MKLSVALILFVTIVSQVYTAPQFITFKDGKLGVNFGGYHAGVGFGGLLDGKGTAGGLFAEAGTPNGPSARAGLGGSVSEQGGASGGLYAGATAGGNIQASAGLGGEVSGAKTAGAGFASAQAGDNLASSRLAGESSVKGSFGATHTLNVKPINKDVKKTFKVESTNEVKPVQFLPLNNAGSEVHTNVEIKSDIQPPVVVKEVYVEPQQRVVEKHIIRTHHKPHRHHFYKTAYLGGYIGNEGAGVPPAGHNTETAVLKKIDVGAEANANAGASVGVGAHGGVDHTYTHQVTYHKNPTFFQDIFNIPISTLKAVGNFLGNTAGNTNVSVQKTASFQAADTDSIPLKHESSTSLNAPISVETPSATKLFDDIFAIPISTLGAVNKFLENNVPAQKNIEISKEGQV